MKRNQWFLLLALAVAFWPVIRWYVLRASDGSDEPWGIAALAIAIAFSLRSGGGDHDRDWTVRLVSMMAVLGVYLATFAWLPSLLKGCLMMVAFALVLPGGRGAPGIRGLLLLSLPVMASAQFFAGYPLRVVAAKGAAALLAVAGLDVDATGAALMWQDEPILVDAPCSGIRMLWVGMVTFCIGAARAGLSWKPFLAGSAIALGLIVAANSVRCALVFVEEAAIASVPGGWHDGVGLAVFAATAGALILLAGRLGAGRAKVVEYQRLNYEPC